MSLLAVKNSHLSCIILENIVRKYLGRSVCREKGRYRSTVDTVDSTIIKSQHQTSNMAGTMYSSQYEVVFTHFYDLRICERAHIDC